MSKTKMEWREMPIGMVDENNGQIPGVPENPRQWTEDDLEVLMRSLEETPELLEARGVIVYENEGRYVALGGNMRLAALRRMGAEKVPCIVFPAGATPEKLMEIVIKDNGSYGHWDWGMLKSLEWQGAKLTEWGVTSAWMPQPVVTSQDDLGGLPEELDGIDFTPDNLEDIKGEDAVERRNLVITYDEDSRWILEERLGVRDITSRVLWRLEDILAARERNQ